jgi:hypothetical protein
LNNEQKSFRSLKDKERALYLIHPARTPEPIFEGDEGRRARRRRTQGEAKMTNVSIPVPAQHSAFQGTVTSLFSAALIVAVGVLTFAAFITA